MKPRKVMIHLEVLTDVPINLLRNKERFLETMWECTSIEAVFLVHQITAQVVREEK